MRAVCLASLWFVLCNGAMSALAQRSSPAPAASPTPVEATQDDVVRVRTNLVQVDAVVVDKDGHQVKDLNASDFEILENRQVRQADHCLYVSLVEQRPAGANIGAPTPSTLTSGDLRRTFVFLVANPMINVHFASSNPDGSFSAGSYSLLRRAIRANEESAKLLGWFVDEKMGASDLAAIASTEINLGVLSSFTSAKEVLHAALAGIRDGLTHQTVSPLILFLPDMLQPLVLQNLSVIETASKAITQIQSLPGRKFLILVSRGMMYDPRIAGSDVVRAHLEQLIAQANKAHVTFYTLSSTGIGNYGGAHVAYESPRARARGGSGSSFSAAQGLEDLDSLVHLANETGGRAIYNTNDMRVGFDTILEENRGYYLLAYNPGAEATGRPHRIQVRVKRPGLHVRARTEAYAPEGPDDRKPITAAETFNTPLAVRDIKVTLNPTVVAVADSRQRVVTSLTVDMNDVDARTKDADGQGYSLELMVRVTGPDGRLLQDKGDAVTFHVKAGELAATLRDGLVSHFEFAADKPGYYRINLAVRDTVSGRVGSAIRFIEVPEAKARK
jgi:VWFA-related protein